MASSCLTNRIVCCDLSNKTLAQIEDMAVQAEGRLRFDEQIRLDLGWQDALDYHRLNHFLGLAKITPKADTPNLLFNLGAGDYKETAST